MDHVKRLRELLPEAQASWTRPENIHLTLKFLGETSSARVEKLSEATARAVTEFKPFNIQVAGSGLFPSRSAPKVLWLGIKDADCNLARLHARLDEECFLQGFKKEKRSFHPHLTVARLRKPSDARLLASAHKQVEFEAVEFEIAELLVIRSELSSAGSRYTTISRHRLDAE